MSAYVNKQVSAITKTISQQQRTIIAQVHHGKQLSSDTLTKVGALARKGLIKYNSSGNLELTTVGNRIALA